jgi:hypothetical protein
MRCSISKHDRGFSPLDIILGTPFAENGVFLFSSLTKRSLWVRINEKMISKQFMTELCFLLAWNVPLNGTLASSTIVAITVIEQESLTIWYIASHFCSGGLQCDDCHDTMASHRLSSTIFLKLCYLQFNTVCQ